MQLSDKIIIEIQLIIEEIMKKDNFSQRFWSFLINLIEKTGLIHKIT